MKTIKKGYKQEESLPLPVWHDDNNVLQYDSQWADDLICSAYGDNKGKYEVQPSTLELFYLVSDKMRFKIAEITYESYFTDVKGQDWEEEWVETWEGIAGVDETTGLKADAMPPEDYEMYNMTIYHYNHPSLKSNLLNSSDKLKGVNGKEYFKGIMERIERENDIEDADEDEDDLYFS